MKRMILVCLCSLAVPAGNGVAADAPATRPAIDDADYGYRLASRDGVELWWCEAARKVGRSRPAPEAASEGVELSAARNEFEAVQLVLRPNRGLADLKVSTSDWVGPDGAAIPQRAIDVLRVAYVPVTVPTDQFGAPGEWPDPLPPLCPDGSGLDVTKETNQPLWILVHVPEDATAGRYKGSIRLTADGWSAAVPLHLRVWDFTLPKVPHTRSAFGLSTSRVFRYHGVQTERDKRTVFAKYMRSFADHRISPYNPAPFDPIEVRFLPDADPPRAEVNFDRFDAAIQRAVDTWHITTFRLDLPGIGGGTFHERHEGQIAGHSAGSPAYEAMFSSMVKQIEAHLRERGWLDKAYIYWFDEPRPRDYEFVRGVMDRLGRYAPGLCRMLTEEPVEPLFGAVDLWCPVTPEFDMEVAESRRRHGERFWWYVCTGPKGPYCTLFIDHPATSLRAWLWQTWQRQIEGILIWGSVYWTSSAAFPDSLQNPYEDPMAYMSGYSTPAGERRHWGNGDGRFLYPPEAAAAGSGEPVLDGPVSSIRWEMLRDGIEDLDYFHILRSAIETARDTAPAKLLAEAETMLKVPPVITSSITHYTHDPAPMDAQRRAVAEMIERLGATGRGR